MNRWIGSSLMLLAMFMALELVPRSAAAQQPEDGGNAAESTGESPLWIRLGLGWGKNGPRDSDEDAGPALLVDVSTAGRLHASARMAASGGLWDNSASSLDLGLMVGAFLTSDDPIRLRVAAGPVFFRIRNSDAFRSEGAESNSGLGAGVQVDLIHRSGLGLSGFASQGADSRLMGVALAFRVIGSG